MAVGVYGVMGVASAFATSFWAALLTRSLVGACHHTVSHLTYVLGETGGPVVARLLTW